VDNDRWRTGLHLSHRETRTWLTRPSTLFERFKGCVFVLQSHFYFGPPQSFPAVRADEISFKAFLKANFCSYHATSIVNRAMTSGSRSILHPASFLFSRRHLPARANRRAARQRLLAFHGLFRGSITLISQYSSKRAVPSF
jgi:hypothetical protein